METVFLRASRRLPAPPAGAAYRRPTSMPAPDVEMTSNLTSRSSSATSARAMKVKTGAPPLKTNPTAMTSNPPHDHIATTMAERP